MGCFCAATLLPLACAYLAVPGEVGRRVGLRRVGMNRETGNVSFWVAAPLGVEAMDRRNFGIVAASLWHHGRWGGAESVIARRIFERHCAADGVVADLGSHVGYFTLLAAAHGCATRSAEIDADFVALLGLALRANGFDDAARHRVFTGAVPAEHSLDAVAAGVRQILYAKVDLEGYEAAAVSTNASALNRTSFAYVECPFVAGDERICQTGSKCMTILGSLRRAGFRLSALVAASKGPGATGGFVPHGRLHALPGDMLQPRSHGGGVRDGDTRLCWHASRRSIHCQHRSAKPSIYALNTPHELRRSTGSHEGSDRDAKFALVDAPFARSTTCAARRSNRDAIRAWPLLKSHGIRAKRARLPPPKKTPDKATGGR